MDTYGNYWHIWQYYSISSMHSFQWQIWQYWHIWQSWHIWQYRSVSSMHSFHSHYIPCYHTADTVTLTHTAIPTYMAMLLCIIHAFIHLHSSQLHSYSSLAFIHLHSSIHPFILSYIPVAHSHLHPSMIIQFHPFCFVYSTLALDQFLRPNSSSFFNKTQSPFLKFQSSISSDLKLLQLFIVNVILKWSEIWTWFSTLQSLILVANL